MDNRLLKKICRRKIGVEYHQEDKRLHFQEHANQEHERRALENFFNRRFAFRHGNSRCRSHCEREHRQGNIGDCKACPLRVFEYWINFIGRSVEEKHNWNCHAAQHVQWINSFRHELSPWNFLSDKFYHSAQKKSSLRLSKRKIKKIPPKKLDGKKFFCPKFFKRVRCNFRCAYRFWERRLRWWTAARERHSPSQAWHF